jgi:hypothetical protein
MRSLRLLRPSFRRTLIALVVAGGSAGIAAVAWGGGGTHYALDPLRDCLALRGGLVTLVADGAASEGTVTLDVKGDRAVIAFAGDDSEARALAGAAGGAIRHGSIVVYGEGGPPGERARSTVERCLSDGEGRPKRPPTGFRYADTAIASFEQACDSAGASAAQCHCVLTGAQAQLPLADFQRIAVATVAAEEEQMTLILDGCRLVG